MGFIETFFKKEASEISAEDIENFVSRKVEENLNLDYTDIRTFENFNELSKDISAFANSAGGLMILGISEEGIKTDEGTIKIFPKEITWGNISLSKEKLEDNIIAKIRPRIDGLKILPVRKSDGSVVFLISVPQSDNPPHMASDNKYYRRLNFRKVPMEHYEVADFFGKRRRPSLSLILEVENVKIQDSVYQFTLRLFVQNIGKAIARHVRLTASFYNLEIVGTERGNFKRIDYLRGDTPSIQFDQHQSVFYPTEVRTAIGDITLKVKNNNAPIAIAYDLLAEDMESKGGKFEFNINALKIAKQMLENGQKPIFHEKQP